jgi:hypothetical protein
MTMLQSPTKGADHLAAIGQIKNWTRERFALPGDTPVSVAEIRCPVPGCPPLETVVVFWSGDAIRHRFKLFKPVTEVNNDDLPPKWLLNALIDDGELDCACC